MKIVIVVFLSMTTLTVLSLPKPQTIIWTGWAEKDCTLCTSQYDPVCATDMKRYKNDCTYKCRINYLEENYEPMIYRTDCSNLPPAVMGHH